MRVLTWNIQNGGGSRLPNIAEALFRHDPDILVLTEYKSKKYSQLHKLLMAGGYLFLETSCPQDEDKGILIASKYKFDVLEIPMTRDQQRWLFTYFPDFSLFLMGVHIPGAPDHRFVDGYGVSGAARKEIYWKSLNKYAEALIDKRFLIVGDFNTGLKSDAEGSGFKLSRYMQDLLDMGYADAWRFIHGDRREYTYYSRQKVDGVTRDHNGFRLDYVFASPSMRSFLSDALHSHVERDSGLSDHAILVAHFILEKVHAKGF